MSLFIFTTQMVGMIYPVFLGYLQSHLGLEEPLAKPRLFGFFVAASTALPSLFSIPCFYIGGLQYVEHKKREEAFIEAAESFKEKDMFI